VINTLVNQYVGRRETVYACSWSASHLATTLLYALQLLNLFSKGWDP